MPEALTCMTYFDYESGEGNPWYFITQTYGPMKHYDGATYKKSDYVDIISLAKMNEEARLKQKKAELLEVIENL